MHQSQSHPPPIVANHTKHLTYIAGYMLGVKVIAIRAIGETIMSLLVSRLLAKGVTLTVSISFWQQLA